MPEGQDPDVQSTLAALFEPMSSVSVYSHTEPSAELPESLVQVAAAKLIVGYPNGGNMDMVTSARTTNINKFKFLSMQFFYCTRAFQTRVFDGVTETKELGRAIPVASSTVHTMNPSWNKDMRTLPQGLRFESPCPDVIQNQTLVLAPPPTGSLTGEASTIDACTALVVSGELIGGASGMARYVDKSGYIANIGILSGPVSIALQGGLNSRSGPLDLTTQ
ncbi:hypothetical protein B0T14DRAFT_504783, partial [Immersiella caudata]